jgi:hypothetical protein
MPAAADIVINNGAGTPVAKTFTLVSPAAGDGSYANWRLKEGAISSVFPRIAMLARPTGNNARKSVIKLQVPSSYTDTVTGLTKVGSAFDLEVNCTVPDDFPEALKNDAVAFSKNLIAHAIAQAVIRDGAPAT